MGPVSENTSADHDQNANVDPPIAEDVVANEGSFFVANESLADQQMFNNSIDLLCRYFICRSCEITKKSRCHKRPCSY